MLTRQYFTTVLASTHKTRLLIGEREGDELRPTLLAVLPACRCKGTESTEGTEGAGASACGATMAGRCRVSGGACRGADGKLASYVGPDAGDTATTEVTWWAQCS